MNVSMKIEYARKRDEMQETGQGNTKERKDRCKKRGCGRVYLDGGTGENRLHERDREEG